MKQGQKSPGLFRYVANVKAFLAVVFVGVFLYGCSKDNQTTSQAPASPEVPLYLRLLYGKQAQIANDRFATLTRSIESAPYLKDIKKLFPRASLNYRYFTTTDEPGFNIETVVNDRYFLAIQVPVTFSADNKSISAYGKPMFYLNEITKAHVEEGRYQGHSSGENMRFSDKEWNLIARSGGDFSAAGMQVRANDPVAGINLVWDYIDEMMSSSNAGITSEWKPITKTP